MLTQLSVLSAWRLAQIEKIATTASRVPKKSSPATIFKWPGFGPALAASELTTRIYEGAAGAASSEAGDSPSHLS